jgi:hypothetical protein
MDEYAYAVEIPVEGSTNDYETCLCDSAESACAVALALLNARVKRPLKVTIRVCPMPPRKW